MLERRSISSASCFGGRRIGRRIAALQFLTRMRSPGSRRGRPPRCMCARPHGGTRGCDWSIAGQWAARSRSAKCPRSSRFIDSFCPVYSMEAVRWQTGPRLISLAIRSAAILRDCPAPAHARALARARKSSSGGGRLENQAESPERAVAVENPVGKWRRRFAEKIAWTDFLADPVRAGRREIAMTRSRYCPVDPGIRTQRLHACLLRSMAAGLDHAPSPSIASGSLRPAAAPRESFNFRPIHVR